MRRSRVPLAYGESAHDVAVVLDANESTKSLTDIGQRLEHISGVVLAGYSIRLPNQIGCSFTATIAGTTMTVAALPAPVGTLFVGSEIFGAGIIPGTTITAYGTDGTYTVSFPHTIAGATAFNSYGPGNLTDCAWQLTLPQSNLAMDETSNKGDGVMLSITDANHTYVEHQLPRWVAKTNKGRLNNMQVRLRDLNGNPVTFACVILYFTFIMRDVEWDERQPRRDDLVTPNFPSLAYDTRFKYSMNH